MEPRFGHDFSQVRVHTDTRAAESARAANALAYTVGSNVVFGAGQYALGTTKGRNLLAHELTHTVQQGFAPINGVLDINTTTPGDQAEHEANAVATTIDHLKGLPLALSKQPVKVSRDSLDAGVETPIEEARRRDQLECVMRLGGCSNTRSAGIPTEVEIEEYNRQCRQETDYTGPIVEPTSEECTRGRLATDAPVSIELLDAPSGTTPEQRVERWLQKYRRLILTAENKFSVDRRAIAGAIAWEALNNVRSWYGAGFARFRGPGKVHYKEGYVFEGEPVAKQIETAGYLSKKSKEGREKILSTIRGSITYIGAIMRAFADVALTAGYQLSCNPPMLTTFFNAWDLNQVKALFKKKKAPQVLTPNDEMGGWVKKNLSYLEKAIGKPIESLCTRISQTTTEETDKVDTPTGPTSDSLLNEWLVEHTNAHLSSDLTWILSQWPGGGSINALESGFRTDVQALLAFVTVTPGASFNIISYSRSAQKQHVMHVSQYIRRGLVSYNRYKFSRWPGVLTNGGRAALQSLPRPTRATKLQGIPNPEVLRIVWDTGTLASSKKDGISVAEAYNIGANNPVANGGSAYSWPTGKTTTSRHGTGKAVDASPVSLPNETTIRQNQARAWPNLASLQAAMGSGNVTAVPASNTTELAGYRITGLTNVNRRDAFLELFFRVRSANRAGFTDPQHFQAP
jgi:hypothetical protein